MSLCEKCYYGDKYCNLRGHGGSGEVISCTKATRLKHKTNADKIRQMTDDELAFYIFNHPQWVDLDGYLNWLKQEVESDA